MMQQRAKAGSKLAAKSPAHPGIAEPCAHLVAHGPMYVPGGRMPAPDSTRFICLFHDSDRGRSAIEALELGDGASLRRHHPFPKGFPRARSRRVGMKTAKKLDSRVPDLFGIISDRLNCQT